MSFQIYEHTWTIVCLVLLPKAGTLSFLSVPDWDGRNWLVLLLEGKNVFHGDTWPRATEKKADIYFLCWLWSSLHSHTNTESAQSKNPHECPPLINTSGCCRQQKSPSPLNPWEYHKVHSFSVFVHWPRPFLQPTPTSYCSPYCWGIFV